MLDVEDGGFVLYADAQANARGLEDQLADAADEIERLKKEVEWAMDKFATHRGIGQKQQAEIEVLRSEVAAWQKAWDRMRNWESFRLSEISRLRPGAEVTT
jgi:peptidoglycan hydrolase CwlO-like protein